MKKIIKWLESNGISFTYEERGGNKFICIIIEKDCIWINGFNEVMKYDKEIVIHQDNYKTYGIFERYEYSLTKTLETSKKSDVIIDVLEKRFTVKKG